MLTKFSKNSQQNNSETVINKHDKEIPKEDIYISPEERIVIIDELRLKQSQSFKKFIKIQRQLLMKIIKKCLKKYLKKDISLQKKDRRLLII